MSTINITEAYSSPTVSRKTTSEIQVEISVAILTYNAQDRIHQCLNSVINQTHSPDEIIVIDNCSSDQTASIVTHDFPNVRLVVNQTNSGCSGGRNLQVRHATYPFVMIVDDDAFLAPDCLEELEKAVQQYPDASVWSPRICYEQDPGLVQFDGVNLHFLGEAVLVNPERRMTSGIQPTLSNTASNQLIEERSDDTRPLPVNPFRINIQGGVAFLIKKDAVSKIGGYDESYFFGRSDGEFTFRLTLAGHEIYTVPAALTYHRMKQRGFTHVDRQVKNRWSMILQTYAWRTILVVLPALVVYELSVIAFLTMNRKLGRYFSANWEVIKMLPQTMRKRRMVQALKRRGDHELLSGGFINMRADLCRNPLIRFGHLAMCRFFRGYWTCAKWFLG
ncbi:MAG: glycosyl transferase [Nitrospirales bacterium]|nr:MAG: glycosyl transferase [Nitrospirales bacterium]